MDFVDVFVVVYGYECVVYECECESGEIIEGRGYSWFFEDG